MSSGFTLYKIDHRNQIVLTSTTSV